MACLSACFLFCNCQTRFWHSGACPLASSRQPAMRSSCVSTTDVVSTQTSVLHTERRQSECTYRLELQIAIVSCLAPQSTQMPVFQKIPTADLTDMLRNVSEYSMKCPTSLCEAMVVLSFYKKTQIGYTQYVDNDGYVDDVDDDEAGAGAYLFAQTQRCSHQV